MFCKAPVTQQMLNENYYDVYKITHRIAKILNIRTRIK